MKIWSVPITLLIVAILAGCAPSRGSGSAATPPGLEVSSGHTGDFPVRLAPDAVQRVTYNSTREIPGPGLYVVDLTTGKVETWQRSGTSPDQQPFFLSDDRRWVVSDGPDQVYWANRQSGKAFGWNPRDVQLLATGPREFLFAGMGMSPRKFYVTDGEFRLKYTFTQALGRESDVQVQFAPDGKTVALNTSRTPAPDGHIYLVDLATGKSKELGAAPSPTEGQFVGAELLGPVGSELVVSYVVQVAGPTGVTREKSIVRRYSWQGQPLGEFPIAGLAARLSADGDLLISNENLDHLTYAAVVTDLATGQPRFRVLGASGSQLTADGSRLILFGYDGSEYLVSTTGELKPAPHVPQGDEPVFRAHLVAAPDDPHRFLSGLTVVDDSGKVLQSIQLPRGHNWLVGNGDWGVSSNEFVVRISPPTGKGNVGFDFPLPPQVQKPPFGSPFILTVKDPKGECLNLRDSYSRTSQVIRCLPTGTRLAVADLAQARVNLNAAWYFHDDQIWLWGRTEQGETGWVSLSSGSVTWAQ